MKKFMRLIFCVFSLIACFQLIGLEEAFCEDSAEKVTCQDCLTCPGHVFAGPADPLIVPSCDLSEYHFFEYSFQKTEQFSLNFLRPPIVR